MTLFFLGVFVGMIFERFVPSYIVTIYETDRGWFPDGYKPKRKPSP
jgi:hypothetical protein